MSHVSWIQGMVPSPSRIELLLLPIEAALSVRLPLIV